MRNLILAVSGLAFGLTACSSSTSAPGSEPAHVMSVSVTLPTSTLTVGQTQMGVATPRDANGAPLSDRTVTWQSSVSAVAAVGADGMVSAVAAGTTVITASSDGVSGSAALTVNAAPPGPPAPVATVSVSLSSSSIVAGQTGTGTATLRDANGNSLSGRVVAWLSSNTSVATVSAAGAISAVAAGNTTISATSESKSGSAPLTVTAPPPPAPVASVSVTPATATVSVGGTQQYTAVTRDAGGNVLTGRTITWASGTTATATVSASGLATGVAAGSATITATSEGVNGTAAITVSASGLSPSVFSDDFETGNMSKWNESNNTTQQVINNSASAHSGNYFVRLTYGIGGQDAGWMNKYFNQGFRQLYVRYYVRFSSNFVGGTKLVGFHGAPIGNPSAGVGRAGICPNGSDSFASLLVTAIGTGETFPQKMYTYWQDMWADSDGRCWGRYGATPSTMPYVSPMPQFTKNVWHKVEYTIKMNSAAGVADGEQRFWVDGVKYGEWKGIRFGDPTRINIGVLIISGSGDTGQVQSVDYDDLILTPDYPAQSQP
jgi:uncharacterized protein YjdB